MRRAGALNGASGGMGIGHPSARLPKHRIAPSQVARGCAPSSPLFLDTHRGSTSDLRLRFRWRGNMTARVSVGAGNGRGIGRCVGRRTWLVMVRTHQLAAARPPPERRLRRLPAQPPRTVCLRRYLVSDAAVERHQRGGTAGGQHTPHLARASGARRPALGAPGAPSMPPRPAQQPSGQRHVLTGGAGCAWQRPLPWPPFAPAPVAAPLFALGREGPSLYRGPELSSPPASEASPPSPLLQVPPGVHAQAASAACPPQHNMRLDSCMTPRGPGPSCSGPLATRHTLPLPGSVL